MSLPTTGTFQARAFGFDLRFDGDLWTVYDSPRSRVWMDLLLAETPLHTGSHITAPEAGRAILTTLFGPDGWTEVSAEADTWADAIPKDAID